MIGQRTSSNERPYSRAEGLWLMRSGRIHASSEQNVRTPAAPTMVSRSCARSPDGMSARSLEAGAGAAVHDIILPDDEVGLVRDEECDEAGHRVGGGDPAEIVRPGDMIDTRPRPRHEGPARHSSR